MAEDVYPRFSPLHFREICSICKSFSDEILLGSMDKNISEQLNKAYEAFRQACMDRDSAVKELKQKTDSYEKQICEQQERITLLTNIVTKLKSQLDSSSANKVNLHAQTLLAEDTEARRNGTLLNLNADQLQEQLKMAMEKEMLLKEQLESESMKLRQTEEESSLKEVKFESIIAIKEDEIRHLKRQLKEMKEAQNCMQLSRYEKEAKSEKHASSRQDLSPGAAFSERFEFEAVFWSMKEEFHRIRLLARAQTDQLSKFNLRREPVTEIPFSTPIQCTDEQADDLCNPWVKNDLPRDVSHFLPITPRRLGQDEEENSVESLSKLNVKFPPMDSDRAFLESSPGTPPTLSEEVLQDPLGDQDVSFGERKHLLEEHDADPGSSAHHLPVTVRSRPSPHANTFVQSPSDRAPGYKPPFSCFPTASYTNKDIPSPEENRTAGTPQQTFWKRHQAQDNDLLPVASADSKPDQSGVCEFCQKVFPPSQTSNEDFFRHLYSHFNLKP